MSGDLITSIVVMLLIVIIIIMVWKWSRHNKRRPYISANATVGKKRIDEWKGTLGSPLITEYYVIFKLEDQDIELKIPKYRDDS